MSKLALRKNNAQKRSRSIYRMLFSSNTMRSFVSSRGNMLRLVITFGLVLWGVFTPTAALGQVLPDLDPELTPQLDRSHAMRAHRYVEDWLAVGTVDAKAVRTEPTQVARAVAVRVTLRQFGLTVGRGQWSVDTEQLRHPPVIDITEATRAAARQAIAQVRGRMNDANLEGDLPTMLVDVQVAAAPEPIDLAEHAPKDALVRYFAPGYHGLILTSAIEPIHTAWIWPADALARNLPADKQLMTLLIELQANPSIVDRIGRPGGPRLLRFEVIHIVRPNADSPRVHLVRGHIQSPPRSLTTAELDDMTEALAEQLIRRQRESGVMAGTYLPTPDRFNPVDASTRDQALALYALARRLRMIDQPDDPTPHQLALQNAITTGATSLGKRMLTPMAAEDVPAVALTLLAIIESPHMAANKELRAALATRLISRQVNTGAFRSEQIESSPILHRADQAMILFTLVNLYEQTRHVELLVRIRALLAWHGRKGATGDLVALPWLVEAEGKLARLIDEPWAHATDVTHITKPLGALVTRQIRTAPDGSPTDVVGGIDMRRDRDTPGFAAPDWGAAFALSFIAVSLRRADLPDDDNLAAPRMQLLLTSGMLARFLSQLMFDPPGCYYVRSVPDALGGMRRNLADNAVATYVTAHALLAATELRLTIDTIQNGAP